MEEYQQGWKNKCFLRLNPTGVIFSFYIRIKPYSIGTHKTDTSPSRSILFSPVSYISLCKGAFKKTFGWKSLTIRKLVDKLTSWIKTQQFVWPIWSETLHPGFVAHENWLYRLVSGPASIRVLFQLFQVDRMCKSCWKLPCVISFVFGCKNWSSVYVQTIWLRSLLSQKFKC